MKKAIMLIGLFFWLIETHSQSNSPNFSQIYDFQVGDIFLYKTTMSDCSTGTSYCDESSFYTKYEITQKIIKGDSLTYERKINDSRKDTVVYIDSLNHALNKYDNDIVREVFRLFGSYQQDTFFSQITIWGIEYQGNTRLYKTIGGNNYEYNNGKYDTVPLSGQIFFAQDYSAGLGLVRQSIGVFELGESIDLIGYRKGNDTTGTLTTKIKNVSDQVYFQVYPNPFTDRLYLSIPDKTASLKIDLFTLNNTLIKNLEINDNGKVEIATSDLKAGVYILRVYNDKKIFYKKIIKQ